jgi:predicted peptidase
MKKIPLMLMAVTGSVMAEPETKTFKASDGTEVLYRQAAPAGLENGKKYPLVLFLHGSGARGNDNKAQLKHGVNAIFKNAGKIGEPTFLIAPQCPQGIWWTNIDNGAKRDANQKPITLLDAVLELTEDTAKNQPIDPERIYITGLSMGGFGTWAALAKKPDLFAAAIPICGGGDPKTAETFKHVPIRIFHGTDDTVVKPDGSQKMFDALKQAGSKAELTLYPGVAHNSWTQTYANEEVIRWLFNQTKSK